MTSNPKRQPKSAHRPEQLIHLRIICQRPLQPERYGAEFGLQDNSTTADWMIHPGRTRPNGDIQFECECRVRAHHRTGEPSFLGPFVHGGASQRFLYLSWRPIGWRPGQPDPLCPAWLRRLKVHLSTITWEQIDKAAKTGGILEAVVLGTGRDGGPSCASVPLLGGGWTVRKV
jgi:Family of unknown function (DUF5990)